MRAEFDRAPGVVERGALHREQRGALGLVEPFPSSTVAARAPTA